MDLAMANEANLPPKKRGTNRHPPPPVVVPAAAAAAAEPILVPYMYTHHHLYLQTCATFGCAMAVTAPSPYCCNGHQQLSTGLSQLQSAFHCVGSFTDLDYLEISCCVALFNRSRNLEIGIPFLENGNLFHTLPENQPQFFHRNFLPCAWLFFCNGPPVYRNTQHAIRWKSNPMWSLIMGDREVLLTSYNLEFLPHLPLNMYLFQHEGRTLCCITESGPEDPPLVRAKKNKSAGKAKDQDQDQPPPKNYNNKHSSSKQTNRFSGLLRSRVATGIGRQVSSDGVPLCRDIQLLLLHDPRWSYKDKVISSILIQSYARGWIARRMYWKYKFSSVLIQRYCRGWLARRRFYLQRGMLRLTDYNDAVQNFFLSQKLGSCPEGQLNSHKLLCSSIQAHGRSCSNSETDGIEEPDRENGEDASKRFKAIKAWWQDMANQNQTSVGKASGHTLQRSLSSNCTRHFQRGGSSLCSKPDQGLSRLPQHSSGMPKLQRWWRFLHSQSVIAKSAILIQSHIRGLYARRRTSMERRYIVMIQSHWRGYLTRKASKAQVLDRRVRMQTSAANIDDKKRLMNKLLSALLELLSMKKLHNISHICETLDSATKYSDRCCEEPVAAGAIHKLQTLIWSASRSIPDQQVSEHALSTLRHLARYPHMADDALFWEPLRS